MSLNESISRVDRAVGDLNAAAEKAHGWSDAQRHRFDNQRMKPLLDAGRKVQVALKRADEELQKAIRLLEG